MTSTHFYYKGIHTPAKTIRHYVEAIGPAIPCRSKKEALALQTKLNRLVKNNTKKDK